MTLAIEQDIAKAYRRDGYVIAPGILAAADLDPFRTVIDRGVDAWARKLLAEGKITDLHEGESFDRRLASIAGGRDMGMRAWDDIAMGPQLFGLIRYPAILDAVESLIGPEIFFNGDFHLRPKLPDSKLTAFPWHQDSQYYGEPTKHMHIVTVTIPLVDLTLDNGCLWMIPGSQKWGFLAGARGADMNIRTFEDVESRGTPTPIPMNVGDIMLFHNLTMHASKLNITNRVRWTLDLRYSPTREAREAAGMGDAERLAYDSFFTRIRSFGYHPATVRSAHGRAVESYEQWIQS
jgi:phytanoyl-CoA hydroxylase